MIHTLADLFIQRGTPAYPRSDNSPEFTAKAIREWLEHLKVQPLRPVMPLETTKEDSMRTCSTIFILLVLAGSIAAQKAAGNGDLNGDGTVLDIVDLVHAVEHDDQHLAVISELICSLNY